MKDETGARLRRLAPVGDNRDEPGPRGEEVRRRLAGGEEVLIRPIRAEDKDGLRQGIERLSPQSRYRRFFTPVPRVTSAQMRYLTEVDHRTHEALLAIDPDSRQGVGVARFVRSLQDPDTAEVAVAVSDEWQRRGVATRLLYELTARAREEGIRRFSASVLAGNQAAIEMMRKLGEARVLGTEGGVLELVMDLPPEGVPEALSAAVRAAARGDIAHAAAQRRPS
jgi:RimJ/RimL family protein N-acetyltransferase